MAKSEVVGVPDSDAEFFARITFGRSADKDAGEKEKVYLDFRYPNLPYGAMVGIQKMLSEGVLPDLVLQGELVAEMMGQPVQSMDEVKAMLAALKGERVK